MYIGLPLPLDVSFRKKNSGKFNIRIRNILIQFVLYIFCWEIKCDIFQPHVGPMNFAIWVHSVV